jgi:hypothetical protein
MFNASKDNLFAAQPQAAPRADSARDGFMSGGMGGSSSDVNEDEARKRMMKARRKKHH